MLLPLARDVFQPYVLHAWLPRCVCSEDIIVLGVLEDLAQQQQCAKGRAVHNKASWCAHFGIGGPCGCFPSHTTPPIPVQTYGQDLVPGIGDGFMDCAPQMQPGSAAVG